LIYLSNMTLQYPIDYYNLIINIEIMHLGTLWICSF
jgi:hypothetical protein